MDSVLHESAINPMDFKKLFPFYSFDLTKREPDTRGDVANTRVEIHFSHASVANLRCFACLLNEKELMHSVFFKVVILASTI